MAKNSNNKKKEIHFKRNFKEYFSIVGKHKWMFIFVIFSVIITEALFVADKFLYKRLIDDAEKFISGTLLQTVFAKTLFIIAIIYVSIVIFRSIGQWLNGHLLAILEPKLIYELKKKYFSHILSLSHKFHSEHKSGSLISRLTRGAGAMEGLTDLFVFQLGPLILQLIIVFVSIAIFTIKPAIALIVVVVCFVTYSIYWQNKQKKSQGDWNTARDKESAFIADSLTNVESIKYFGAEKRVDSTFKGILENSKKRSYKYWDYFSKMALGQFFIIGVGAVLLLYFPLIDFLNGKLTLGTITFIYALYGSVASNLFRLVWGIRSFYRSMGNLEDLLQYGEIKNEIIDKANAKSIKVKKGSIDFNHVNFTYPGREERGKGIFRNFNLSIKPNEKIALVGKSGSGKTTIAKLINRLYDINSGEILIDGEKISDIKQESLRSETGIVPQEAILFDDTIFNNIKFAKPNATRKEILKSIRLAQLDKIVNNFPKGVETIVGERGVKLSGGEKQRVSIARAILANKKILILDEATSALDSQTESDIQKALKKLLEGRTSIIIAHRLSTIMEADRIIVLDKGKIVEQGTHQELLKKKGRYYKFWNMQSGGYLQN